MFFIEIMHL